MSVLEIITVILLNPIRFPAGLFRLWLIEERRRKSVRQILNENDLDEICLHGTNTFLQIFATIGVILILGLIAATIVGIFRNGFTH